MESTPKDGIVRCTCKPYQKVDCAYHDIKADKDQATKRPWEITEDNDTGPKDDYFVEWIQIGPVMTIPQRNITNEDRANARLIVKAVNAHDQLVEALKGLISYLEEHYDHNELIMNKCDIYKQVLKESETN